jgi:hypothetical protein
MELFTAVLINLQQMPLNEKEQLSLVQHLPDDLQLAETGYLSEEDLLQALAGKVAWMLQYNRDVFFQLMYRMDVPEARLLPVMEGDDISYRVARLIYERELEKVLARRQFGTTGPVDTDLAW